MNITKSQLSWLGDEHLIVKIDSNDLIGKQTFLQKGGAHLLGHARILGIIRYVLPYMRNVSPC